MESEKTVSAAIVTHNDCKQAILACKSLLEHTKRYPLKLYVFDNASCDDTVEAMQKLGVTVIKNNKNKGFGAAHNKAISTQMGKYHFVINPDIILNSDVISDMVDFFESNPDVVMAMPKILNCDGSEQRLPKEKPTFKCLLFGRLSKKIRKEYVWANRDITAPTQIDFCSGCFFGIRSDLFCKLGGFDERFFLYLEDADLTLRAKNCGKVMFLPQFSVIHLWHRESAKNFKCFLIHLSSCFKFIFKWRGTSK